MASDRSRGSDASGAQLLGVSGGSGSGKTTLVTALVERLGAEACSFVSHDWYYRDASHLPMSQREVIDFDHPGALDSERLVADLTRLRAGEAVNVPQYDFATHTRRRETRTVEPRRWIVVEGILIFSHRALRERFDRRVFVDAPEPTRFARRVARDTAPQTHGGRGRTEASVREQWARTVEPSFQEHVATHRGNADLVLDGDGVIELEVQRLVQWLGGTFSAAR